MTAPVRLRYPVPQISQIVAGRVVRSPTLSDIALASNWAQGRGTQLVPLCSTDGVSLTSERTYRFPFYTRPTFAPYARIWTVVATGDNTIDVSANGDTATVHPLHRYAREGGVTQHLELLGSQSEAAAAQYLEITPNLESATVHAISCVEVPRATLNPSSATERAVDMATVARGAPIYADSAPTGADYGMYLLADALDTHADIGRRVGHFAWSVPYLDTGVTTTNFAAASSSGTAADLTLLAVTMHARPGVIAASTGLADTSATVRCAVMCWASDGTTTGTVDFKSLEAGDTQTATISGTTPGWAHTASDLAIATEDPSDPEGLQGSVFEEATISFQRTAGAGTVYVAGIMVYES